MEDAFESANVKSDYPVAMMLIAVGFFIVTLVEIAVTQCQKSRVNPSEVPDHTPGSISATGHGHSHSHLSFSFSLSPRCVYHAMSIYFVSRSCYISPSWYMYRALSRYLSLSCSICIFVSLPMF